MISKYDNIYQTEHSEIRSFTFDARVADVFGDMISRSVPGYTQILSLLPTLTKQFAFKDHAYYDLGCSLGASMIAMAQGLHDTDYRIIGIDNSEAMLSRAKPLLERYQKQNHSETNNTDESHNVQFQKFQLECQDLTQFPLEPAAMVVMNFTLQFIALEQRDELIDKIYAALASGGALVISEKVSFSDPAVAQTLTELHHQFKADQGYSQLEISQKRDAIENVLIPESLDTHITRLKRSGFSVVTPWIQNLQFISILAIK